jgi:trk/ktr system potassium uptake protein
MADADEKVNGPQGEIVFPDNKDPVPENKTPRVFVVGLGQTGREVVCKIMLHAEVVALDINQERIEIAREYCHYHTTKFFKKDGTSRLSWEDLDLCQHDTIVCTCDRDEVNLEVCRVVREDFGARRTISLVHLHSAKFMDKYESLGVETVSRPKVLAAFLESRVLQDKRSAERIGLGQGELIEVTIMPGSPVIGRKLITFRARPWKVAAIYRNDKLVVPGPNILIEENDRAVLVGEPHILSSIAEYFKMGEPEFPLQYGPRIGVLPGSVKGKAYNALVAESNYLARNSMATGIVILSTPDHPEPDINTAQDICGGSGLKSVPAYLPDEHDSNWPVMLQGQDFGCIVIGISNFNVFKRLGIIRSLLMNVIEQAEYPILISRGTHPYKNILFPVSAQSNPIQVADLSIHLARMFEAKLDAITVTEPSFAVGPDEVEHQRRVLDRILEHTSLYNLTIRMIHKEGNPIKEVVREASEYDLVIMGHKQGARWYHPRLNLAFEIMIRTKCSVMLLPYKEKEREKK